MKTFANRFILVRTGQMPEPRQHLDACTVHPRAYGADTKFLKEISALGKPSFFSVLDFHNKTSMYHFRLSYFCG